jgi:hypothetical protein
MINNFIKTLHTSTTIKYVMQLPRPFFFYAALHQYILYACSSVKYSHTKKNLYNYLHAAFEKYGA